MTEEELIDTLKRLPYRKRLEVTKNAWVDENTTYKDLVMLKSNINTSLTAEVHSHQADKLKPRFDNAMLHSAIIYLLENNVTPVEVFQYIKGVFSMEDEWLKIAKHTTLKDSDKTKVAKMIIDAKYPIVEELDSRGLSVKDAIIGGRSPTKQINTVSDYLKLNTEIKQLKSQVCDLELRQVITECRLEQLESKTTSKKDIAHRLKVEGKSTNEISELLNTPVRTVRRWLSK